MGTGRLGRKPTPKEGEGEGGLLERSFVFLSPSRFQTVFYVSWLVSGGDPSSGAETLAGSSPGSSGDQGGAGGRTLPPASVARVPQSWEFGEHSALTCRPFSPLKPESLAKAGLASSFSLVPPPNLSETFENKILFVPPPS